MILFLLYVLLSEVYSVIPNKLPDLRMGDWANWDGVRLHVLTVFLCVVKREELLEEWKGCCIHVQFMIPGLIERIIESR